MTNKKKVIIKETVFFCLVFPLSSFFCLSASSSAAVLFLSFILSVNRAHADRCFFSRCCYYYFSFACSEHVNISHGTITVRSRYQRQMTQTHTYSSRQKFKNDGKKSHFFVPEMRTSFSYNPIHFSQVQILCSKFVRKLLTSTVHTHTRCNHCGSQVKTLI